MGEATALRFAEEGAKLILNDVRPELLDALMERVGIADHVAVPGDVSAEPTAATLAETATERWQAVDILVNNAGIMAVGDVTDAREDEWQSLVDINATSMILCCKHIIPLMLRHQRGAIVNLASTSAYVGQEMQGKSTYEYNMTKAAVRQLTTSLATRYAPAGIRVNSVCPGLIVTNLLTHMDPAQYTRGSMAEKYADYIAATPLGRAGEPREVANAIVFLASDEASFITGANLPVDGGYLAR